MQTTALPATKRTPSSRGYLNKIRREGRIPAVIYGLGKEPELVEVSYVDIRTMLNERNKPIALNIEGTKQDVLIKAVDKEAIKKTVLHIDFLRVDDSSQVIVNVPVETTGVPVGVKTEGGVFSVMKKFVTLRARVKDIPEKFLNDVSEMSSDKIFYVRDLVFEKGRIMTPAKTALYGVSSGRKAEPAAGAPAAAK